MPFLSFQRTNATGRRIFVALILNIFALVLEATLIPFLIVVLFPKRQNDSLVGGPCPSIHSGYLAQVLVVIRQGTVVRAPRHDEHEHVRPELSGREVQGVSEKGISEEGKCREFSHFILPN